MMNRITRTIAFVACLLLLSTQGLSAADSSAPGAQLTLSQRVSSWWSGVKDSVARFFGTPKSETATSAAAPATPSSGVPALPVERPATAGNTPSAVPSQNTSSTTARESVSAPAAQAGTDTTPLPTKNFVGKDVGPVTVLVQLQPVLKAVPTPEVRVVSVPPFAAKPRKPFTFETLAESERSLAKAQARVAKFAPKASMSEFSPPSGGYRNEARLAALDSREPERVEPVSLETMNLLRGLFPWLRYKPDESEAKLHPLALSAKSAAVKGKAFAFSGWILEEAGARAASALALSAALQKLPASPEQREYLADIARTLIHLREDSPLSKEWLDQDTLDRLAALAGAPPDVAGFALLVSAERAHDRGQFLAARKLAQNVPPKSRVKDLARFLAATALIAAKDSNENYKTAGRELTELFRSVDASDVFDATATTLGRIHFVLGNYKAAHQYLSQVSRDTNLYIESAVDNAWALLRDGDRNHAVGNMFTLHTPYFEGAYMPDSYFLQSLGYQEICQFGDAITSVKQYKMRYHAPFKSLSEFHKEKSASHYDDLVAYLSKKEHKLAPIVLRELGRHPEFLRRQKNLNLMSRDEAQLAQKLPASAEAVLAWSKPFFEDRRKALRTEIAGFLKRRAHEMEEELQFLTANMSLLEYEIFAGASQNLALQGAQNFAVDEKKAVPKRQFEDGKEYWPFEDEVWEDELNSFRSKIVDACAHAKGKEAAPERAPSGDKES